jgi:MFS family permease
MALNPIKKFKRWLSTPQSTNKISRKNFKNVQLDALGVGLANSALPFIPVFLTRLGASNLEIGLVTSLPAISGFLLSLPVGQILENRKNIIPWYSISRFIIILRYALISLAAFFVPDKFLILIILFIWGLSTIPQTLLSTGFSMVMNLVAGPDGRYELMARRWSILGITTSVIIFLVGQFLDRIIFPLNYQLVFLGLTIGGFISYHFSKKLEISIPSLEKTSRQKSPFRRITSYFKLIGSEKPFISFSLKRFVYMFGLTMVVPLLPIYFVREIHAPDSWIAIFSTSQSAVTFLGYFFWMRQSKKRGARFILLTATLCLSIYPMVIAYTTSYLAISILAGVGGIFQAGLNLVFFDELMKLIPIERSATFISLAQVIQFGAMGLAPFISSIMVDQFGIVVALLTCGGIQLLGFLFFTIKKF